MVDDCREWQFEIAYNCDYLREGSGKLELAHVLRLPDAQLVKQSRHRVVPLVKLQKREGFLSKQLRIVLVDEELNEV